MEFAEFIEEIVRRAANIQLRSLGRLKSINFKDVKGKNDIVTEVDTECENLIVSEIKKKFPEHNIIAEESGVQFSNSSPYKWLIDPLDGTMNYTHAYPFFCISIALEYDGEIIYGLVHDPIKDETFIAQKGRGCKLNGCRVGVSATDDLRKSLVVSGTFSYHNENLMDKYFSVLRRITKEVRGVRRDGSAALDLCYVACGRVDGFWEYGLNPWDVAAGSIIVSEAGGLITNFSSMNFSIYDKELIATNSKIHNQLVSLIY